jgi:hypothetical protein
MKNFILVVVCRVVFDKTLWNRAATHENKLIFCMQKDFVIILLHEKNEFVLVGGAAQLHRVLMTFGVGPVKHPNVHFFFENFKF